MRKKVLFISPRFPYPLLGGDVIRIFRIAENLKNSGHEISLLTFVDDYNELECSDVIRKVFNNIYCVQRSRIESIFNLVRFGLQGLPMQVGYYYSYKMNNKLKEILSLNSYDYYVAHLIRTMPYINKNKLNSKTILEMTDALSLNYIRLINTKSESLNIIKKIFYSLEYRLVREYEKEVVLSISKTVVVSETDKKYLRNNRVVVHKNGVEISGPLHLIKTPSINPILGFIGNLRTVANIDMLDHFIEKIYPEILIRRPGCEFHIIGPNLPHKYSEKYRSIHGIVLRGVVQNLQYEICDFIATVCPMRIGAGIQNKILESMAFGIPVVTTKYGAEGIISNETPDAGILLIANNDTAFVEKCLLLIENMELRVMVSKKAYEFIRDNFAWDKHLNNYLWSGPRKLDSGSGG